MYSTVSKVGSVRNFLRARLVCKTGMKEYDDTFPVIRDEKFSNRISLELVWKCDVIPCRRAGYNYS